MKTLVRPAAVLAASLSLALSAEAFGDSPLDAVRSTTVRFADLNMSKPAGAQTLYSRIKAAARLVCREVPQSHANECFAEAVERAVLGVGNPLLTATHRAATERESIARNES